MDHFQDIFQQAVSIKSSQMLYQRQKFENQPLFIKVGLYFLNKFENVRNQDFNLRFYSCDLLKQKGNSFFKNDEITSAAREYEQVKYYLNNI